MPARSIQVGVLATLFIACTATVVFVVREFAVESAGQDANPNAQRAAPSAEAAPVLKPVPGPGPAAGDPPPIDIPADAVAPGETNPPPPAMGFGEEDEPEEDPFVAAEPAILVLELLRPAEQEERTVTVRVEDVDGVALPGALVVFRRGPAILYRERTNRGGVTEFAPYADEKGPFRVDVLAEGYVTQTASKVAEGVETVIVLRGRPAITGEVRAQSTKDGVVKLFMNGEEVVQKLGADGRFEFYDLDEGEAVVQAEVQPYGVDSLVVQLNAGETRHVKLRIRSQKSVKLKGRFTGWPGSGEFRINGLHVHVGRTGRWSFDKGVYGMHEFVVDAPGKALFKKRILLRKGIRPNLNFKLLRESRIRGTVREAGHGKPIAGAEIRCGVNFGNPRNYQVKEFPIERVPVVRSDRDGRFEIGRLDNRLLFELSARAQGYGGALITAIPSVGRQVRVELPPGPYLYGRLRGRGGVPRDALVEARPLEEHNPALKFNLGDWRVSRGRRDHNGWFGLSGLMPGSYLVTVTSAEFGTLETVVDFVENDRRRLDIRLRRRSQEDDDAELLQRLPPVFEEEELPPEQITHLLVDANRAPHKEPFRVVRVQFFLEEQEIAPTLEFDDKLIDLTGLPEGQWRAVLTHPTLKKPIVSGDFTLERGRTTEIVVGDQ
ncbi:MAG: carboxypeptidase-like regulatory domain-containing protein [Planctomycetota bacterium]